MIMSMTMIMIMIWGLGGGEGREKVLKAKKTCRGESRDDDLARDML